MSKLLDLWGDLTGVVLDYALSTPPSSGWLMCYGQTLTSGDAATARLRQKLIADGFPHGQDGSGNPKVPDVRGRVVSGKDNMGGPAAGRLTTAGAGIDGNVLGAAGGAQTHTLTTAQLAAHNHGVTDPTHAHSIADPGHSHSVYDPGHAHNLGRSPVGNGGTINMERVTGGGADTTTSVASTGISIYAAGTGIGIYGAGTGISIQNNGSGSAHNNTQPTVVMNKIIKL